MLRHQETIAPDTLATQAAQTRVTAQELTDAVRALEARRAERARGMEGTLPIGEAIEQLGLEATPDEILAEVEAQRARQAQTAALRGAKRHRGWLVPIALVPAFFAVGLFTFLLRSAPMITPATAVVAQVASPLPAVGQDIQVIDEAGGRKVVRTLAEIGDNQPVRCGWADAVRLLPGGMESLGSLPQQQGESKDWHLVKFGGQFYLRGWLALPMSETALRSGPITLYSVPPASEGATKITLPVATSRFGGGSVGSEPETIRLSVPVPDAHLRDRW